MERREDPDDRQLVRAGARRARRVPDQADPARNLAEVAGHAASPQPSGKEYRLEALIKEGLSSETAKKVAKIIRDEGPKGIKTQIQGDELRVTGKSRDDLQTVIALLKGADVDADLQFTNYR